MARATQADHRVNRGRDLPTLFMRRALRASQCFAMTQDRGGRLAESIRWRRCRLAHQPTSSLGASSNCVQPTRTVSAPHQRERRVRRRWLLVQQMCHLSRRGPTIAESSAPDMRPRLPRGLLAPLALRRRCLPAWIPAGSAVPCGARRPGW